MIHHRPKTSRMLLGVAELLAVFHAIAQTTFDGARDSTALTFLCGRAKHAHCKHHVTQHARQSGGVFGVLFGCCFRPYYS